MSIRDQNVIDSVVIVLMSIRDQNVIDCRYCTDVDQRSECNRLSLLYRIMSIRGQGPTDSIVIVLTMSIRAQGPIS